MVYIETLELKNCSFEAPPPSLQNLDLMHKVNNVDYNN